MTEEALKRTLWSTAFGRICRTVIRQTTSCCCWWWWWWWWWWQFLHEHVLNI